MRSASALREGVASSGLIEPSPKYHEDAAATRPREIDWLGQNLRRFIAITDTSSGTPAEICISNIISAGVDDIISISFQPCLISERVFLPQDLLHPRVNTVSRVVFGSSSLENKNMNAVIKEIEDGSFSRDFLNSLGQTLAQINRLAQLPEGWDSYGGERIDAEARRVAARFLSHVHALNNRVPAPVVGPHSGGGVVIQWWSPDTEIYVSVSGDAIQFYAARPDEEGVIDEGTFAVNQLEDLATRVTKFLP
jgi:hypothetical protein